MRLDLPTRRPASIALTPLIDVVFILLLFFMLSTRFGQPQAMELRMPGEGTGASETMSRPIVLRLNADGTIALPDGKNLEIAELDREPLLRRLIADATPVRLSVDDEADLQELVSLLDRLDAIGLVEVSVEGLGR